MRIKDSALTLAFALGFLAFAQGAVALAQEPPPFPILYGGRALMDGEPLAEGTTLVARVGDYETETTVERNGVYRNLLVSPTGPEYFYAPVTFHAMGATAEEGDVFLPASTPVFKDVGFDLHFRSQEDKGGLFQPWMAIVASVPVVVLAGWVGARRRWKRR